MLRYSKYLIIGALSFICMFGCNEAEPVCPDTQSFDFKLLLVRVKDTSSSTLVFYNSQGSIVSEENFPSILSVPVDLTSDSTTFFIDFVTDSVTKYTDTIAFTHESNLYLNERECGFIMNFKINHLYVLNHQIDSALWLNNLINETNAGNLKIFY